MLSDVEAEQRSSRDPENELNSTNHRRAAAGWTNGDLVPQTDDGKFECRALENHEVV
jgi:hypothetical protein